MLIQIIEGVYRLLWGDLLTLHLGNVTLSLSFMVILLLTAGVFFTLRTRLLPVRLFRDMLAAVCEKNDKATVYCRKPMRWSTLTSRPRS